jgi:hypothetical protein
MAPPLLHIALSSLWLRDLLGYLAGSLVLATFSVNSMRLLRCIGIASNLAFMSYAIMASAAPILIQHGLLLPVNIYRLVEIERHRRAQADTFASPALSSAG